MHLKLDWDNAEKTIIRLTLVDGWTWDDLAQVNPVGFMLVRESDHPVHLLLDFTQTDDMPTGGMAFAANLAPNVPSNLGLLIAVTGDTMVQRKFSVLKTVFSDEMAAKVRVVDSFETAYALFAAYP